jgi:RNA polymerase sigma-70 factor (ECF subfamily)
MTTSVDTTCPDSFEALARELTQPLSRYLQRSLGDPALAEDLLQETLMRIANGLPNFAGRASVKTWAFSIATRVAADHFRRPAARAHIVDVDEASDIADEAVAIDDKLAVDEMNACVRQVIDSLPEDYRAALVLHDLEHLDAREVAEICGCSLATAKVRIHRARQRLRHALQSQCDFYRDADDVFRCCRK